MLDTEFLRERTYRPQLCVVQVKHGDTLALVDVIALAGDEGRIGRAMRDALAPFVALVSRPDTVKVFHSGSQDLEILWLLAGAVPTPVFDTQLAAPLLGHPEQIGYANLVRERLGVELDKSQTRADWTRRPLPERQVAYALDDVVHLEALYLSMRDELAAAGRLEWLEPEFRDLERSDRYDAPAAERWRRIRQVTRYKGAALSVIQALAEWRELRAREADVPRNWLMKDETITAIAQQRPASAAELGHVRGLDRRTREAHGDALVALVRQASEREPEPHAAFRKKPKATPATLARARLLDAWVHQRAVELDIAPGTLVPPERLERLALGEGREALAGWRDGLVGEALEGRRERPARGRRDRAGSGAAGALSAADDR